MEASRDQDTSKMRNLESREMDLRAESQNDGWSQDHRSTCFSRVTVKPSAKQTESERFELKAKREELQHCKDKLLRYEKDLMVRYATDVDPQVNYYMEKLNEIRRQQIILLDKDLKLQSELCLLDKRELKEPAANVFFPNKNTESTRKKTIKSFFSDLVFCKQTTEDIDEYRKMDNNKADIEYRSPEKQGFTFTISDDSYFKAIEREEANNSGNSLRGERENTTFDVERKSDAAIDKRPAVRQKMDSEEPPQSLRSRNLFLAEADQQGTGLLFGRNKPMEKSLMRKTFQSLAAPSVMEPERVIRNIQKKRDRQSRELLHPRDPVENDKFTMAFLETPKRSFKGSPMSHDLHEQNERLLKMNKLAVIAGKRLTFKSSRATMQFYAFPDHALRPIPSNCTQIIPPKGPDNDCDSTDSVIESGKVRCFKLLTDGLNDRRSGLPKMHPRASNR